jgi:hypothetical protein
VIDTLVSTFLSYYYTAPLLTSSVLFVFLLAVSMSLADIVLGTIRTFYR